MPKDVNKVMFSGFLGADPEMRYMPDGKPVVNFRVGSNRAWRDSSGELRRSTEWFRVVAWKELATICAEHLLKGSRVFIEGRQQTRSYKDEKGTERFVVEVIAQDMIILSAKEPPTETAMDEEEERA
jgi:single-strand DNA-binding protein